MASEHGDFGVSSDVSSEPSQIVESAHTQIDSNSGNEIISNVDTGYVDFTPLKVQLNQLVPKLLQWIVIGILVIAFVSTIIMVIGGGNICILTFDCGGGGVIDYPHGNPLPPVVAVATVVVLSVLGVPLLPAVAIGALIWLAALYITH